MKRYDVCIIGGGPAGYAAAMRAVDFRKRVLLVERDRIGGAGIYNGALSSKAFWEVSREYAAIGRKFHLYGVKMPPIAFSKIMDEVRDAIGERSRQLEDHMHRVRERHDVFDYVQGFARLGGRERVDIETASGETVSAEADHIILATGSRPRKLPNLPIDERNIMTSDGIDALEDFPESLVILGAGVIGCEFATIFSNFGTTRVHLIEKASRILPFEDEDLSTIIAANLAENGVHIHLGAELDRMVHAEGRVRCSLTIGGEAHNFETEKALVSVGRVPNIEDMGLETVGIALSPAGHLVNQDTRSSVPNIYGVGDLTADVALVNVGELEGRHAIEKIFGTPEKVLNYENISAIMFLNPETAGVGMNEQQAQQQGLSYRMASYAFSCIPRAVAMRRTQGFFKVLVSDDDEMRILGMRAVGEHASSAIQGVALLISMNKGISELAELIHPHPSIIEGVQECVRMLLGKSIFKPDVMRDTLIYRRFHEGKYVDIRTA